MVLEKQTQFSILKSTRSNHQTVLLQAQFLVLETSNYKIDHVPGQLVSSCSLNLTIHSCAGLVKQSVTIS